MKKKKGPTGKKFEAFPPRYSWNYILNGRLNPRMDTIRVFFKKICALFLIFKKKQGNPPTPPPFLVVHLSLGTDTSLINPNPAIFSVPPGTENLNTPPPRQTKAMIHNSNVLHIVNNNTYADFRKAYKDILILSVIQVI